MSDMAIDLLPIDTAAPAARALVVPLGEAHDAAECGNKAANLARLLDLGVAVPPGIVVINTALERFLDANELRGIVDPAASANPSANLVASAFRRKTSSTIQSLILAAPPPQGLREAIASLTRTIGTGPYIVRSSARGEDTAAASFAGQLDSAADIPAGRLIEAVLEVWASRWSQRAIAYGLAKGAALGGMGVVIQQQVASRWSGVLFTESPADRTQMLVEFCDGMGEALVSGRRNPGRLTIARHDFRFALETEPEDCAEPVSSFVNERDLAALGSAALAVERHFEAPQDIEWAMDGSGALWIVQSRPITVASRAADSNVCAAVSSVPNPGIARVHWSNANVNENFPDPISPLLYSIASAGYYHYFRNLGRAFGISRRRLEAMEQPLRHIIGVHGARMYYNLSSIHSVLRSAPCGELLAASFNQFVGSESTDTTAAVPLARRATERGRQAMELSRVLAQTTWQYLFVETRVRRFERRADAFAARTNPERLAKQALPDLLAAFRGFLHIRCRQWNDAALADAGAMVCYGVLQRLLARAFPEEDQQALHNSLLKALPGLVSGQPAIELWRLSELVRSNHDLSRLLVWEEPGAVLAAIDQDERFTEFKRVLAGFQEHWGFRCSGELMLTVPSFQEDAAPLIGLIRNYLLSNNESPLQVLQRQADERLADTARVQRQLRDRRAVPFVPRALQRPIVSRVLRWTQACICLRERARLKQALLYSRLRRIVLEIGGRLAAAHRLDGADDIFFLTAGEIDALLSGSAMFPDGVRALVALRRDQHEAATRLTPPDSFTLLEGEYFSAADAGQRPSSSCGPALQGLGACGGVVTAPAAVLADVKESDRLRAGDVLVTRQTDPGWGPVFPLISGLVVERGGMLSHGAIIAREFGIPSVVGVRNATRAIAHGRIVTVDGNRGAVRIDDASAPLDAGSAAR
jgi:rifampicin phosphotransferase